MNFSNCYTCPGTGIMMFYMIVDKSVSFLEKNHFKFLILEAPSIPAANGCLFLIFIFIPKKKKTNKKNKLVHFM